MMSKKCVVSGVRWVDVSARFEEEGRRKQNRGGGKVFLCIVRVGAIVLLQVMTRVARIGRVKCEEVNGSEK